MDRLEAPVPDDFALLRRFGQIMIALGYACVILGAALFIASVLPGDKNWILGAPAVFVAIAGVGLLVSGYMLRALVAIERNTRATWWLLHQQGSRGPPPERP